MLRRIYGFTSDFIFGGAVCGVGDVAAQAISSESVAELELDRRRTGVVALYGATVCAPYHMWYKFLGAQFPGTAFKSVVQKTACEIGVALPFFEVPAFTLWTGRFSKGETLEESLASLRSSWSSAVLAGMSIWGPASLATFGLVRDPTIQLRIFYVSGSLWACAISWLSFREHQRSQEHAKAPLVRRTSAGRT